MSHFASPGTWPTDKDPVAERVPPPFTPSANQHFLFPSQSITFLFHRIPKPKGMLTSSNCPTMASEPHLKVRHCRVNTHPSNGLFALRSDRKPTVHWERRAPRGLSPSPLPSMARLQQSRTDLRRWRADLSILRVLERVSSCSMRPLLLLIFE